MLRPAPLTAQTMSRAASIESLTNASTAGDFRLVAKILSKDATLVNELNNEGCTPLIAACLGGNEAIVSILLKKGASLHNVDGRCPCITPRTAVSTRSCRFF